MCSGWHALKKCTISDCKDPVWEKCVATTPSLMCKDAKNNNQPGKCNYGFSIARDTPYETYKIMCPTCKPIWGFVEANFGHETEIIVNGNAEYTKYKEANFVFVYLVKDTSPGEPVQPGQ